MLAKPAAPSSKRRERGQSLVELAISLTVMLLLLSGAVTFGMALFSYVAIRDAAGEGALFASISPNNPPGTYVAGATLNSAAICARVKAASDRPVNMTSFTCTTGVEGGGGHNSGNAIDVSLLGDGRPCESTGNGIRVTVDFNQTIMMPYIGAITGQQIHLRAGVTETILQPRCTTP